MENDKKLFTKLKIRTLLDLALIIPVSYSDTTLSESLSVGSLLTAEATVTSVSSLNGKLSIQFYLPKFAQKISSLFFRATPYHYKLFTQGSTHHIQGKLEQYNGYLQMPQPKSIKTIGQIVPKYKCAVSQEDIRRLMANYITQENLYKEGLDSKEVSTITSLHFPKTLQQVYNEGKLSTDIIKQLKFIEAFNHIKKLQGKKEDYEPMSSLNGDIDNFIKSLPFELTAEQAKSIGDIKEDLSSTEKAAKRMIVGDVGSGKTMVILASVMMAYPQKSMLMAPTSLLAIQLYEESIKYLPKDIKIALVTQNNKHGDYTIADFIIGTHALIHKGDLPVVPLVMIDEQHRFGTKQRQMLETLVSAGDKRPHFLQFSATPIPRTQAMMESELIDISMIKTTPFKKEIETTIISKQEFPDLLSSIKDEISHEHQVLIIYPLVEKSSEVPYQSIEESSDFWRSRFDNVYVTHGKDKQKEQILIDFREQGDILLATTVVEVGISLPRLTIIVIVGAERLGLATLHQLRGRVGRNGLKSHCYLYTNNPKNQRLEEFSKTTSGFDIAKLDLKFRNSGDILDGTIQSGKKFVWLDMAEDDEIVASAKSRASIKIK